MSKKTAKKAKTAKPAPKVEFPIICALCGGRIEHAGALAENGTTCIHCAR